MAQQQQQQQTRKRNEELRVASFEDVREIIMKSKKIVILAGAGISVSCGIPDFRSPGGIYSMIDEEEGQEFGLPDPQAIFDIEYFLVLHRTSSYLLILLHTSWYFLILLRTS